MKHATSPAGYALIQRFEGYSANPYLCPAGETTIGYGHVIRPGERFDPPVTRERALSLLMDDLSWVEEEINALPVPLSQGQFDALASFVYNVGPTAFASSTLKKCLLARDFAGAARQFPRWVRSKGAVLPGLVTRRAAERALFLGEN